MIYKKWRGWMSVVLLFCVQQSIGQISDFRIIPEPAIIEVSGGNLKIESPITISFKNNQASESEKKSAAILKEAIDLQLPKYSRGQTSVVVTFNTVDASLLPEEGYEIIISKDRIEVVGREAGLFYAVQSLLQFLPLENKLTYLSFPCVEIADEPSYHYRGLHLDVSRHFFPISFIKVLINQMAFYKLNNFHWHLTDDQGWRIEIKKYPKLTEHGGFRAQSLVGNYHDRFPQFFDGEPHGGYYTQKEIKEIVQYAQDRYINIIPEIDMPGHSLAAISAYPELTCVSLQPKVAEKWGIFEDVLCPGKESTFDFIEDVLVEVISLFPSEYIHIGGDECPKERWTKCKDCLHRMQKQKLKNHKELQSYFIKRVELFLNKKGKKIIGWDEILEGGIAPNATIMAWRGIDGGVAAVQQDHDAIMTPSKYLYLDHAQDKSDKEPVSIGGYTPLEEVYNYNPMPKGLSKVQESHVIGVQANIWTEYMDTPNKVTYMVFPRLLALSEIAWTSPKQKDYTSFIKFKLPYHLAKLDKEGIVYKVPKAIGAKDTVLIEERATISLYPPVEAAKIYYTLNGYNPDETGLEYTQPIQIKVPLNEYRELRSIVISPSGKRSVIAKTIVKNQKPKPSVYFNPTKNGLSFRRFKGAFNTTFDLDTAMAREVGVHSTPLQVEMYKRPEDRTFGIIFEGYILIPQTGIYNFSLISDDGSILLIDDELTVDNEGRHSIYEAFGASNLISGYHRIKIKYFDGGGGNPRLKCYMWQKGKEYEKKELPLDNLFYE